MVYRSSTRFGALAEQLLLARADISITFRFIAKILAPKQCSIALVVNCAHDGNVLHHACCFTMGGSCSPSE